jgi:hypothetical protein
MYLNKSVDELGLEQALANIESYKNNSKISIESQYTMTNLFGTLRQFDSLSRLFMVELLQ